METKTAKPDNSTEASMGIKNVGEFAGEVKQEIFRITWPSWEELKVYTQITVAATFLFGIGLYVADLLIQGVLGGLGLVTRLISG
jgi:preprotein translocase subunit SecE